MANFDPYHVWLGIPPDDQPVNYYQLLGVGQFEASAEVLESAADRQMAHVRSFQGGKRSEVSQRVLNEIATAKAVLLSEEKRAAYDAQLREPNRSMGIASQKPLVKAKPLAPKTAKPAVAKPTDTAAPKFDSSKIRPSQSKTKLPLFAGVAIAAVVALAVGVLIVWQPWNSSEEPLAESRPTPQDESIEEVAPSSVQSGQAQPQVALPIDAQPSPGNSLAEAKQAANEPNASPAEIEQIDYGATLLAEASDDESAPEVAPGNDSDLPTRSPSEVAPLNTEPMAAEPSLAATTEPEAEWSKPKKLPIPSASERKQSHAEIADLFQLNEATTTEQRVELATKLTQTASETTSDYTSRFVLWNMARGLLAEAAQVRNAMKVVALMEADFEFDADQVRRHTFVEAMQAGVPSADKMETYQFGVELIDELMDQEKIEEASALLDQLLLAVRRARNKPLLDTLVLRKQKLEALAEASKEVASAQETLANDPEDEQAHGVLGRYLTFLKMDWKKGLVHLAKSESGSLATAAKQDLQQPTAAGEMVNLANAWQAAAEEESDELPRLVCLAQSHYWYQQAVDELSGLRQLQVKKELETLAAKLEGNQVHAFRAAGPVGKPQVATTDSIAEPKSPTSSTRNTTDFAKLNVDGRDWKPFEYQDGMPPLFRNAEMTEDIKQRNSLKFTVEQPGLVYLLASFPETAYQGNTGGGWYETRTTREQLRAAGWRDLGEWPWEKGRVLFISPMGPGEYTLHTNKYSAPRLIRPKSAELIASSQNVPEPAAINPTTDTGPVAYWTFDEGAGDTARDQMGKHHGRIIGATWVDGVKGKALRFDGDNDVVIH